MKGPVLDRFSLAQFDIGLLGAKFGVMCDELAAGGHVLPGKCV